MKELAIYAGTFDPLTFGHLDIIERATHVFGRLIVAIAVDTPKKTLFTVEERMNMARETVKDMANVEVVCFDHLLVDYAKSRGVKVLIRGLRTSSDFEYEFQMALMNRKMTPEVETLFMTPKETHNYISSSTVKDVARLGGDVTQFVPPVVAGELIRKFRA